jgi:molybdopterin converting factor small subunit
MKLIIHLSGIARDLAGMENLYIEIDNPDYLNDSIIRSVPGMEKFYFSISVNGKLVENYSSIKEEDNILVFSPVAGG